jgi:UDP-N-acetyl-D-galactosamine dehydrogenase
MSHSIYRRKLSVTGLGYVGLPVAVAFAAYGKVIAFDINEERVGELRGGRDRTGEVTSEALNSPTLHITSDPNDLREADFHIITVPTPVTEQRRPDLRPLLAAIRTVGRVLKKSDIVVIESTVYPGATEEECVPLLEAESGLKFGTDFTVGYSPERINPGDRERRFETITKVVAGSDAATLAIVSSVYNSVVKAGVHETPSIKVAEAAKVIENTQRDLNIALMNELALIFDRMGIRTSDVLAAAQTKWNFLRFSPGLVGGHCIGIDPYYLTAKAEALGYHPEVILAGRRINDGMGGYAAQKLIKLLVQQGLPVRNARVGIFGLTFKEDVPDLRNSRVKDIIVELRDYGIEPLVHDPLASAEEVRKEFDIHMSTPDRFEGLHALILAVPHRIYRERGTTDLLRSLLPNGIVLDVKSMLSPIEIPGTMLYWSL